MSVSSTGESELFRNRMQNERSKTARKKSLLSPFRYPGGKTWLRPLIRLWLRDKVTTLIEVFGGSAVVSLTAVNEGLAKRAVVTEKDPRVAAVWTAMLNGESQWLCKQIKQFQPKRKNVERELRKRPRTLRRIAWLTLLQNRVSHGGLIAPGAGIIAKGRDHYRSRSSDRQHQ